MRRASRCTCELLRFLPTKYRRAVVYLAIAGAAAILIVLQNTGPRGSNAGYVHHVWIIRDGTTVWLELDREGFQGPIPIGFVSLQVHEEDTYLTLGSLWRSRRPIRRTRRVVQSFQLYPHTSAEHAAREAEYVRRAVQEIPQSHAIEVNALMNGPSSMRMVGGYVEGALALISTVVIAFGVGVVLRRWFIATRRYGWQRHGRCLDCGYDVRHDYERGCPECGWNRDDASTDAV